MSALSRSSHSHVFRFSNFHNYSPLQSVKAIVRFSIELTVDPGFEMSAYKTDVTELRFQFFSSRAFYLFFPILPLLALPPHVVSCNVVIIVKIYLERKNKFLKKFLLQVKLLRLIQMVVEELQWHMHIAMGSAQKG